MGKRVPFLTACVPIPVLYLTCCVLCQGIVLNLLFDSEMTRRLGVETHVCELQLVLRSFAAIVWALQVQS